MRKKIILLGLILAIAFTSIRIIHIKSTNEQQSNVEQAVTKAAITCYAIEGCYPPLDYLVEHYGIVLDEQKYIYHYEMIGSNILPIIKIFRK